MKLFWGSGKGWWYTPAEENVGSLLRLPPTKGAEVLINYSSRRRQGHSREGLDLSWPLRSHFAAR